MGSSARFLQMVEGPLPECTADDRAGIVHHHVADAAAGVGELVGHDVETVRLDLKHAIEATRRVLADTWVNADVPEARADLLHAIYDRIVVAGRSIVAARLTPAAYANGLALALPQVVMARPEGAGRALATYRVPIEGGDEWIAAATGHLA